MQMVVREPQPTRRERREMRDQREQYVTMHSAQQSGDQETEAAFVDYFEPNHHRKDRNGNGAEPAFPMIIAHWVEVNNGVLPPPAVLRDRLMGEVPTHQRVLCSICGFTGHDCTACSINLNGQINKHRLATYLKERSDRRINSAWLRGGILKGLPASDIAALTREIDEIRAKLPASEKQQEGDTTFCNVTEAVATVAEEVATTVVDALATEAAEAETSEAADAVEAVASVVDATAITTRRI